MLADFRLNKQNYFNQIRCVNYTSIVSSSLQPRFHVWTERTRTEGQICQTPSVLSSTHQSMTCHLCVFSWHQPPCCHCGDTTVPWHTLWHDRTIVGLKGKNSLGWKQTQGNDAVYRIIKHYQKRWFVSWLMSIHHFRTCQKRKTKW